MAKKDTEENFDLILDDIKVKRCLVKQRSYINLRLCNGGDIINYVGKIGSNLIDLTDVSPEEERRLVAEYSPR